MATRINASNIILLAGIVIGVFLIYQTISLSRDQSISVQKLCSGDEFKEEYAEDSYAFISDLEKRLQDVIDAGGFKERMLELQKNESVPVSLMEDYQNALAPFLEVEPPAPMKVKQRPIPLSEGLDCGRYSAILTGKKRDKPVKVYDLVTFSTELDLLEVRMHELNESVDHFVVSEASWTHRRVPKPLYFARNRERYIKFRDKIIHLVIDYSAFGHLVNGRKIHQTGGILWTFEETHRKATQKRFEEGHGQFEPDAIVIDGDVDEIPTGHFIYHLKHCETKSEFDTVIINNNLFYFNFRWVKRNNWQQPAVTLNNNVKRFQRGLAYKDGRCSLVMVKNPICWHISYYGNPAFLMWKSLSIAEGGKIHKEIFNVKKVRESRELGEMFYVQLSHEEQYKVEISWESDKLENPISMPWVVFHNPKRYPFLMEGISDVVRHKYFVST